MTRLKIALWAALLLPAALWLLADGGALVRATLYDLRDPSVQLTGVVGIAVMSLSMILSARPAWLETPLGGLDKMYRLHKWLGIAGLVLSIAHWFWATAIRWLKDTGLVDLPESAGSFGGGLVLDLPPFYEYTDLAEELGEWGFYALVLLVAVSLLKAIPYQWFRLSHKLLGPIYLLLVFHSVVLTEPRYWTLPVGIVTGVLMAAGTIGALIGLLQAIGWTRRVRGSIASLLYIPDLRVLVITVDLRPGWTGHRPGQFAFLTTNAIEGGHPYSIASPWVGDGRIDFVIKELGDYTRTLNATLKVGDGVHVEGPYGRFDFRDDRPEQIWVGAGIGIAPFLARLRAHAGSPPRHPVYFYHTTGDFDERAIERIKEDATAAHLRFRILVDSRDGFLSGQRIRSEVPGWESASVWFCGPAAFGRSLRRDLVANGLPGSQFHEELFEMR